MSRIADAFARAGRPLPQENSAEWDAERAAAEAHLNGAAPAVVRTPSEGRFESDQPVAPKPLRPEPHVAARVIKPTGAAPAERYVEHSDALQGSDEHVGPHRSESAVTHQAGDDFHDVIKQLQAELSSAFGEGHSGPEVRQRGRQRVDPRHSELAAAVRRICLDSRGLVRSVLFCAVPGDSVSDVAWQAAELLAAQSGRRIAFVDDAANSVVPTHGDANGLITRVGWYEPGAASAHPDMSNLYSSFAFVIVHATAPTAEDFVPIAREVDGVIVVVNANQTRADVGEKLVATLRSAGAHCIGAVLVVPSRQGG
jgi:hypothetical protein